MADATCDIGLIGLAVMGQNLVLNMNDHGYKVCVFNRTTSKVDEFLADEAKGTLVEGAHSIEEMCSKLKTPRRVMIMVKAGDVVDKTINTIVPFLEKGDIIIDGGNSLFTDSNRRTKELAAKGLLYNGRFRWGRGSALRAVDYAGRRSGGVAACEGDLPGDRGEGGRRNSVL
jgi:6-phosphogluconate dehydrogenase